MSCSAPGPRPGRCSSRARTARIGAHVGASGHGELGHGQHRALSVITGVHMAVRARISVGVAGGTVDVIALGN